ncbi:MAG TPA: hypothetical protein V6C57_23610 [Coleofasciculaceae cyanobacterium]
MGVSPKPPVEDGHVPHAPSAWDGGWAAEGALHRWGDRGLLVVGWFRGWVDAEGYLRLMQQKILESEFVRCLMGDRIQGSQLLANTGSEAKGQVSGRVRSPEPSPFLECSMMKTKQSKSAIGVKTQRTKTLNQLSLSFSHRDRNSFLSGNSGKN